MVSPFHLDCCILVNKSQNNRIIRLFFFFFNDCLAITRRKTRSPDVCFHQGMFFLKHNVRIKILWKLGECRLMNLFFSSQHTHRHCCHPNTCKNFSWQNDDTMSHSQAVWLKGKKSTLAVWAEVTFGFQRKKKTISS